MLFIKPFSFSCKTRQEFQILFQILPKIREKKLYISKRHFLVLHANVVHTFICKCVSVWFPSSTIIQLSQFKFNFTSNSRDTTNDASEVTQFKKIMKNLYQAEICLNIWRGKSSLIVLKIKRNKLYFKHNNTNSCRL